MKLKDSINKVLMPFGKSGNIYLLGAIGQGLGPVLLTPVLTRQLDAQSYGEITFVNSFAAILGILFTFGLPIVISRSYVLEENSRPSINKWFKQIVISYLVLSFLLLIVGQDSISTLVISLSLPFAVLQLILPLARAQEKAIAFASISIIGILTPSLGVILNSTLNFPIASAKALVIGALLGSLISIVLIWPKDKSGKLSSNFSLIKSVKNSYPILPHMFAMVALINIDKVIFGQQLDKSVSGYLQVIMLIGTAPIMILSALNHAWLNQILLKLKKNSKEAFTDLNSTIIRLFALSMLFIIFIVIFHSQILTFLNPNLVITTEIQKTIILASLVSLIYVIYLANTHLLTWQNKFWILGITTPMSVIFQSLIIYLTIDSFGYISAGLGLGVAMTIQVSLLEIFRSKTLTKGAIDYKYLLISLTVFWATALYFLI
jgi:O-antigen/teichoic acid export membrane protein